jgi:hypothetical protein
LLSLLNSGFKCWLVQVWDLTQNVLQQVEEVLEPTKPNLVVYLYLIKNIITSPHHLLEKEAVNATARKTNDETLSMPPITPYGLYYR